jgi:hypothetical protein
MMRYYWLERMEGRKKEERSYASLVQYHIPTAFMAASLLHLSLGGAMLHG